MGDDCRLIVAACLTAVGLLSCTSSSGSSVRFASPPPGGLQVALCPEAPSSPEHRGKITQLPKQPPIVIDHSHGYCAYMHTASGVITIRLLADAAPTSVNNFVYLAEHGFYDGLTIDRTCPNPQDSSCPAGAQFVESSTRSGTAPQYVLPHEKVQGDYLLGSVLMDGNSTSDDPVRFLIATRDDRSLPKIYNLFGQVTGGIVEAAHLKKGDVIDWIDVRATTA